MLTKDGKYDGGAGGIVGSEHGDECLWRGIELSNDWFVLLLVATCQEICTAKFSERNGANLVHERSEQLLVQANWLLALRTLSAFRKCFKNKFEAILEVDADLVTTDDDERVSRRHRRTHEKDTNEITPSRTRERPVRLTMYSDSVIRVYRLVSDIERS